ncbi:hypothetical protein [Nonomuraea sp. NPDC001699]
MTPAPPPPAAQSLQDSSVGGDNIQIGAARDVSIATGTRVPRKYLLVVLVVVLLGAVAASGVLKSLSDAGKDLTGAPVLSSRVTSRINVGDVVAMRDVLTSGSDLALLQRGPNDRQLRDMLDRHHAARVGSMNIVIVLQGNRNRPVRIIDVRPHVITSGAKPAGTCIRIPSQGDSSEFKLKVDLDRQRPEQADSSRFLPHSVDLEMDERMTIDFTAEADDRWYEWDIEVVYDDGTGTELKSTFIREPSGEPFRVTGQAKKYAVAYGDKAMSGYRTSKEPWICGVGD